MIKTYSKLLVTDDLIYTPSALSLKQFKSRGSDWSKPNFPLAHVTKFVSDNLHTPSLPGDWGSF